jgi:hypothetical protein
MASLTVTGKPCGRADAPRARGDLVGGVGGIRARSASRVITEFTGPSADHAVEIALRNHFSRGCRPLREVLRNVEVMLSRGLIHGDLSAYHLV